MKKSPNKNLHPVVLVILTMLSGGAAVHVEHEGTRLELLIEKSR